MLDVEGPHTSQAFRKKWEAGGLRITGTTFEDLRREWGAVNISPYTRRRAPIVATRLLALHNPEVTAAA